MTKPFLTEALDDRQFRSIQTNVETTTKTLREGPFGDGVMVELELTYDGYYTVDHGLGREPQGFVICDYQTTYAGVSYPTLAIVSDANDNGYDIDVTRQVVMHSWTYDATAKLWFW